MGKYLLLFLVFSVSLFVLLLGSNFSGDAIADQGYAGIETCKACHGEYYGSYAKSIHAKKAIPGSAANREGCESCHGPGATHANKGGGKGVAIFAFSKKMSAKEKSAKCQGCHEEMRQLANWSMSRHKAADVACSDCHSIHKAKVEKNLLKVREPEVCYRCHQNIRAKVNKQSHHPIDVELYNNTKRVNKVNCTDCHNPMGTFDLKNMLKADSVNDLCYKCHAEKRGPYAFEHPPVPENCLYCHDVHGSNHNRLLTRKAPLLCQSCHDGLGHPSRPYNNLNSFLGPATAQKNRFFGRSCLNCHNNIHGSNHPALGGHFVR